MRNRFNEIKDIREETDQISDASNGENFDDPEFSTPSALHAFSDVVSDEELEELDKNTAPDPRDSLQEIDPEYTDEELKELWDNDPGYVNDKVMYTYATEVGRGNDKHISAPEHSDLFKKNGELRKKFSEFSELYKETGLHWVSWDKDAVEGTENEIVLKEGTLLDRWSDPDAKGGRYLCPADTNYDDLHLNVSQDKRELTRYEVLKPFTVTESIIADQGFDDDKERKEAKQYRSSMDINDLIENGYLKKITEKDKI